MDNSYAERVIGSVNSSLTTCVQDVELEYEELSNKCAFISRKDQNQRFYGQSSIESSIDKNLTIKRDTSVFHCNTHIGFMIRSEMVLKGGGCTSVDKKV